MAPGDRREEEVGWPNTGSHRIGELCEAGAEARFCASAAHTRRVHPVRDGRQDRAESRRLGRKGLGTGSRRAGNGLPPPPAR
jgi:hypothetical protein